jgi:4-methylaminobutanoate oxidase (formaldehyde-forming)
MLTLNDNKPGYPLLLREEPIYLDDNIVGKTTSGNYSFNYNKNLSFGYIGSDFTDKDLLKKNFFIEVEKKKYAAEMLLNPLKQSNFKKI